MADQDKIAEELNTNSRRRQGPLKKGFRGSRLIERILVDCKSGPSETLSHIMKVLGLDRWQGLHPVEEMESTSLAC